METRRGGVGTGRLLSLNLDPIKLVPQEQRDVWTRQPKRRCCHEDGRGRCTSRDTRGYWNRDQRCAYVFCEKHYPAAD
jgi:hypothetical protein